MTSERGNFTQKASKMMPAKSAAQLVGYSPDYVGRLAREKKIVAVQSGRQWMIDTESLKLFQLQAEAEKRARHEELRKERLHEHAKEKVAAESAASEPVTLPRLGVLAQAVLVCVCGAFFSGFAYVAERESLELEAFASGAEEMGEQIAEALGWGSASLPQTAEATRSGIVVLGEEENREYDVAAVRESFSDPVTVEFDGVDTGVVTPQFRNRVGTEYRFLLVPVQEEGLSQDVE